METTALLWEGIVGQDEPITRLRAAIKNQSLSHAYFFVGADGVGKFKIALTFAAALNCPQGGCGTCSSCTKFLHATHPDLLVIEPEGHFILLPQIHELIHKAVLKPVEAVHKVYIIREADSLNTEAANSLLKILEEPPADLIFILVASYPQKLPETIISRCQLVKFNPVSTAALQKILMNERSISEDQARLIARLGKGVLGEALSLIEDDWKLERRSRVIRAIEKLAELDEAEALEQADILLDEAKMGLDGLKVEQKKQKEELKEIVVDANHSGHLEKILEQRFKRQQSRKELAGLDEVLDIFASWFRDCLIIKESRSDQLLINLDQTGSLRRFSENLSSDKILSCLEIVERTRQRIRLNVDKQLALEVMLLNLQEEIKCRSLSG